jgi:tetratricopeptide (TPR) repeat protein
MNKLLILAISSLLLGFAVGCGGDDDGDNPPPQPPSDAEVLQAGWDAFTAGDYAEAEAQFDELLGRERRVAEAHDGLGWTFARQNEASEASVHFSAAFAAGADTLAIEDEAHAGLAFAQHALERHVECLAAAAEVAADWVFAHEGALDRDDLTVLEASAHYALGEFADALARVQELDPSFDADVATVEGRAALAARIESLLG